jgi:hypothetical protein
MVSMQPKIEKIGILIKKLPKPNQLILCQVMKICAKVAKDNCIAKTRYPSDYNSIAKKLSFDIFLTYTQVLLSTVEGLCESMCYSYSKCLL